MSTVCLLSVNVIMTSLVTRTMVYYSRYFCVSNLGNIENMSSGSREDVVATKILRSSNIFPYRESPFNHNLQLFRGLFIDCLLCVNCLFSIYCIFPVCSLTIYCLFSGKLMYNLDYLSNLSTDQFARDYVTRVFGVMTDMVDRLPGNTNWATFNKLLIGY